MTLHIEYEVSYITSTDEQIFQDSGKRGLKIISCLKEYDLDLYEKELLELGFFLLINVLTYIKLSTYNYICIYFPIYFTSE